MAPSPFSPATGSTISDIELDKPLVCGIGHSNRSIGTFVDLLRTNESVRVLGIEVDDALEIAEQTEV